jgi:hypothetical protein
MRLNIVGNGNFDRIEAPVLKEARGWRSYPPATTFRKDASDDLGISGTKTFEMAVIPEERKTKMPAFDFTFFDPVTERYVTLSSDPAPLRVEGGLKPVTPAPVANVSEDPKTRNATPPLELPPEPDDIHGVLYERGAQKTFQPLYLRTGFWVAQSIPAVALLLFTGLRLRRPRTSDVLRHAALRRERTSLLPKLRGRGIAQAEFFDTAARIMQIDAALASGVEADSVDADFVCAHVSSPADTEVVNDVFNARAELHFAGGAQHEAAVSEETRARVLSAVENLGRTHAKN